MDRLISQQAAIEAVHKTIYGFFDIVDDDSDEPFTKEEERFLVINKAITTRIKSLPSAQPERKRGKWQITEAYPHNVYCSECHHKFAQTHWAVWEDGTLPRNYCPNCGSYNGGGDR